MYAESYAGLLSREYCILVDCEGFAMAVGSGDVATLCLLCLIQTMIKMNRTIRDTKAPPANAPMMGPTGVEDEDASEVIVVDAMKERYTHKAHSICPQKEALPMLRILKI